MPKDKDIETKEAPQVSAQVTNGEFTSLIQHTKELLALQPKKSVRIRQDRNPDPKAPNFETVCINGYLMQIKKGVDVEVPLEVYNILDIAQLI